MISGSIGSPNELDCHRGNELKIHGTSTSPTVLRPWAKRSCSRARRDVRPAPPKGAPGSLWSRHFFSWCHFCICLLVGWIFTECQRTREKKNRRMNDPDELSTWTQGWHTVRISTRDQVLTEHASNLHAVLPGNLFANMGGPFTRRAEASRFLSLNSFFTPHLYTARIHSGHTVFLPTPLTVFYIHGPHTLPDNQPVQMFSFSGMGRTGPTPLPY